MDIKKIEQDIVKELSPLDKGDSVVRVVQSNSYNTVLFSDRLGVALAAAGFAVDMDPQTRPIMQEGILLEACKKHEDLLDKLEEVLDKNGVFMQTSIIYDDKDESERRHINERITVTCGEIKEATA